MFLALQRPSINGHLFLSPIALLSMHLQAFNCWSSLHTRARGCYTPCFRGICPKVFKEVGAGRAGWHSSKPALHTPQRNSCRSSSFTTAQKARYKGLKGELVTSPWDQLAQQVWNPASEQCLIARGHSHCIFCGSSTPVAEDEAIVINPKETLKQFRREGNDSSVWIRAGGNPAPFLLSPGWEGGHVQPWFSLSRCRNTFFKVIPLCVPISKTHRKVLKLEISGN